MTVFTPESWGSGPSQMDMSYVDFKDDVETYLGQVEDKIQEGIDWVWQQWDDSLASKFGPFVGLGAALLIKHMRDNLEDAIEAIWDKFVEVCEGVWEKVKEVFATPWGLMDMSGRYSEAAGLLRGEAATIDRIKRHIQKGWQGDAYDSYGGLTDEQKLALTGLAGGLSIAATACSTSAQQIFRIWIALMDYILDQVDTVLGKIKDATDAGQWVSLEAGVVTSLVGQLLVNVGRLVTKLIGFWADNETVNFTVWNNLNNGADLPGVVVTGSDDDREVNWPEPSPSDTGDVGDKNDWTHKA